MTVETKDVTPSWHLTSYNDFNYLDENLSGLRFSQGLVWDGDSSQWIATWQYGMARLTADFQFLQTTGTVDTSTFDVTTGIPQVLADMGFDHIGDIDYYQGKLYVSLDVEDETKEGGDYNNGHVAVFNASDLSYTGTVYELVGAPSNEHHDVASWVAVDGANGLGYGKEWQLGNTINVYNLDDWSFKETLTMDQSLKNIQGAKVLDGMMYMAADNSTRSVYSLDLSSGHVIELFQLPDVANADTEVEGIEAIKDADGNVVLKVEMIIDPDGDNYADTYTRVFSYTLDSTSTDVAIDHTWVVNTISDTSNSNDMALTLREAIAKAEDGDTIAFSSSLKGQTITLADLEVAISKNIKIEGDIDGDGKADITIDGGAASSALHVTGGSLVIDGVVVLHDEDSANNSVTVDSGATVTITNGSTTVLATESDDAIDGTNGVDVIHGGAGDDVINGLRGTDILYGDAGDDMLNGGAGIDTMVGGAGDDTYFVDNVGDVVTELANGGTDTVKTSVNYTLGDYVENLGLLGTADITGTGNALANVIVGNSGDNLLSGLDGNDTLNGGAGADTLVGGNGDDTYFIDNTGDVVVETKTGGTDTVTSSISYTLGDYVENLRLTGTAALSATGNALANTLTGNGGANVMHGGAGADIIVGGSGNDVLYGDASVDTLSGGAGDDKLYGGAGRDVLSGGAGADQFIFAEGDTAASRTSADTIEDMRGALGDRIDLHLIDADEGKAGNQAFKFIGTAAFSGHAGELHYEKTATDTYITADTDGDRKADFTIHLDGAMALKADYFAL